MVQKIDRRKFLASTALALPGIYLAAQAEESADAAFSIPQNATGATMPANYLGLSYEIQQLTDPKFFSRENAGLIGEFKALASKGVLRLGGNTSEFGYWKPNAASPEPEHPQAREVAGEPKAVYYAVTPDAVRNLSEFLQATGWTCIYGIGMGTNVPERAASEAEFAAKTLGDRLEYFQLGNEVDLFSRHLRNPNTWSAAMYLDEWLLLARAITARVPNARFGMPDVSSDVSWLTSIAELWPTVQNPPRLAVLSHHHYFNGPATNPDVNIPNLLKPAEMAKVEDAARIATTAAEKIGLRVRMTEGNTCYRGGKPGVSDVFAAALWAADYSLRLARHNYTGINLHGGTGKSVANSVGGFLPGDVLLKDQGSTDAEIATHPHPFYTPIATFGSEYRLQPVGYGLKFAGLLCAGTFLPVDLNAEFERLGLNASGYAVQMPGGSISIVILNKEASRDFNLSLTLQGRGKTKVQTVTLQADSLESREVKIAQSSRVESLSKDRFTKKIPHASGILLHFS